MVALAALKAEPVFQSLFDSQALEWLPAFEEKLDAVVPELSRVLEVTTEQAQRCRQTITQKGVIDLATKGDIVVSSDIVGRDKILVSYVKNICLSKETVCRLAMCGNQ